MLTTGTLRFHTDLVVVHDCDVTGRRRETQPHELDCEETHAECNGEAYLLSKHLLLPVEHTRTTDTDSRTEKIAFIATI